MKECEYCTSEIPDKAKKCKYCGEWVEEKPSSSLFSNIKETFKKGKAALEKRKIEKEKERKKHLYVPTNSNPLVIKNISFYGDYLEIKNKQYNYSKIASISFKENQSNIQGNITYQIDFFVYFDINDSHFPVGKDKSKYIIVDLSAKYMSPALSNTKRKLYEQTRLMYNSLNRLSLQQRYQRYFNSIEKKGYFYYDFHDLYPNGDIMISGTKDVIANINDANNEGKLLYKNIRFSDARGGGSYDPYRLEIVKGKGLKVQFIGINLYSNISLNVTTDKDVFDYIFSL